MEDIDIELDSFAFESFFSPAINDDDDELTDLMNSAESIFVDDTLIAQECATAFVESDAFMNIAKVSMESLDVVDSTTSLEGADKDNMLKRIWEAIKNAFKKLVYAIQNMMITIANFIGKGGLKSANKLYDDVLKSLPELLDTRGDREAKVCKHENGIIIDIDRFKDALSMVTSYSSFVGKISKTYDALMTEIEKASDYNVLKKFVVGGQEGLARRYIKTMKDEVDDAINKSFGKLGLSVEDITGMSPSAIANMAIFGSKKIPISKMKIRDFFQKCVEISLISRSASKSIESMINVSKTYNKEAKASLKSVNQMAATVQSIDKKFKESEEGLKTAIAELNRVASVASSDYRTIVSRGPMILNNLFNRYLKIVATIKHCLKVLGQ